MLRLLAGAVRQADDGEARNAVLEMRLDLDPPGIEPHQGMGDGPREHRPTLRRKGVPVCDGRAPIPRLARDQYVLVVLAGATARPTVHVPAQPILELQPGALEDLGIEVPAVVHDDHDGCPPP
jgi:hypothetical protein